MRGAVGATGSRDLRGTGFVKGLGLGTLGVEGEPWVLMGLWAPVPGSCSHLNCACSVWHMLS